MAHNSLSWRFRGGLCDLGLFCDLGVGYYFFVAKQFRSGLFWMPIPDLKYNFGIAHSETVLQRKNNFGMGYSGSKLRT